MTALPQKYAWLGLEPGPKMLVEALADYGTHEVVGHGSNPKIIAWREEIATISPVKAAGVKDYTDDDIAWCGLAMAHWAHQAGKEFPDRPLWARNWSGFGVKADVPKLGDILVFAREGGGGHVGLCVGTDDDAYHVLGGNTSNAVSIARLSKARLLSARRPDYHITPPNVRVIHMGADGPLSENEA